MTKTATLLIIALIAMGGIILLQIFLSRKSNRWLGLILPVVCFAYSLLMIFGIAAYNGMTGKDITILIASTLFISNIPTLILLAVYFACREKQKLRRELDRMNVQDLD